jgi:hypothetical protein
MARSLAFNISPNDPVSIPAFMAALQYLSQHDSRGENALRGATAAAVVAASFAPAGAAGAFSAAASAAAAATAISAATRPAATSAAAAATAVVAAANARQAVLYNQEVDRASLAPNWLLAMPPFAQSLGYPEPQSHSAAAVATAVAAGAPSATLSLLYQQYGYGNAGGGFPSMAHDLSGSSLLLSSSSYETAAGVEDNSISHPNQGNSKNSAIANRVSPGGAFKD